MYLSDMDYLILLSRTILCSILECYGGKHSRYKYLIREKQLYSQIFYFLKNILASSLSKIIFKTSGSRIYHCPWTWEVLVSLRHEQVGKGREGQWSDKNSKLFYSILLECLLSTCCLFIRDTEYLWAKFYVC